LAHNAGGLRVLEALELSGEELHKYLSRRSREPLRVAGTFAHMLQRTMKLPAVEAALAEMVASEARQQLVMPVASTFVVLGHEEQDGEPQVRVAASAVAHADLEDLATAFRSAGSTPRLVTTVPHAVQALLAGLGLLGDEPVALLDAAPSAHVIYVFQGQEIRVVRALPEGGNLARDVKQTFVFHASKFRGDEIRHLWVAGTAAKNTDVANLQRELDCEVAPLDLHAVLGAETTDLAGFTACAGLAMLDAANFPHTYVAPSIVAEARTRRVLAGMAMGLLVASLAVAVPGALLSRQVQLLHVQRARDEGAIHSLESWLQRQPRRMIAHQVRDVQPAWEMFLRELALATPVRATLQNLTVRRGAAGWEGSAAGSIPGCSTLDAVAVTADLKSRLQSSEVIQDVEVVPLVDEAALRFELRFRLRGRTGGT
jgi:hypothetical protein